jgi:hypothetical protein
VELKPNLVAQAEQIGILASRKDDPFAWAEILSCWRLTGLRSVLIRAMESIGWDKLQVLIRTHDGWPDGVAEIVTDKRREAQARRKVVHGPGDHSDYDLADF